MSRRGRLVKAVMSGQVGGLNSMIPVYTVDNRRAEKLARGITVDMGAVALVAAYPATAAELRKPVLQGRSGGPLGSAP